MTKTLHNHTPLCVTEQDPPNTRLCSPNIRSKLALSRLQDSSCSTLPRQFVTKSFDEKKSKIGPTQWPGNTIDWDHLPATVQPKGGLNFKRALAITPWSLQLNQLATCKYSSKPHTSILSSVNNNSPLAWGDSFDFAYPLKQNQTSVKA